MFALRHWICVGFGLVMLAACSASYPETCPESTPVGLASAAEIARDERLPFRFPLEASPIDEALYFGWFGVSNQCPPGKVDCYEYPEVKFHAAEDYKRPPGTPVYAMADGIIHFSGRAGGYGWLILIDHPQANLYSLYGHLSPSRWKLKNGTEVERGDLIAYLGDADENGGSAKEPLDPHLHFGIRAGQTIDYPAKGEWRYMGGWIRLCPQDVGWLQPSLIITGEEIPTGGFEQPHVPFVVRWGFELFFAGWLTIGGVSMLIFVSKKASPFLMLLPGVFITAAGIFLNWNGLVRGYFLALFGGLLLAAGIYLLVRRRMKTPVV